MERYNFKEVDSKWQKIWDEKDIYKSEISNSKKEILLLRNVSIPIWENSHGSCSKLYYWRYSRSI